MPLTGKSPLFVERPETFGRFRVRADLGANRFGPVYLGRDPSSGARVTIRTFEPDVWSSVSEKDELLDSFRRLCASKLDHPHIARPIAHGVEGNLPYVVYSYLPGTPMDVVVRQDGVRSPEEVLRRMTQVADAIDFAAKSGTYHGMMAPCDLIFDHEATGVAGFGLAQALLRVGVSIEADAPYASPQRIAGAPPAQADDVYSLAALTLELLIGKASEANQDASRAVQGLPERRRVPRPAPHETRLFTTIPGVDAGRLRAAFAAALSDEAAERQGNGAEFVAGFRDAFSEIRESEQPIQTNGSLATFTSEKIADPPAAPVRPMTPAPEKPSAGDLPFRREPAPVRDFEIREKAREPEVRPSREQSPVRVLPHPEPVPVLHSTLSLLHDNVEPRRGGALVVVLSVVAALVIGFTGGYVAGQRSLRLAIAPDVAEETQTQARADIGASQGSNPSSAAVGSGATSESSQPQQVPDPELRIPSSEPRAPRPEPPPSPSASARRAPPPPPASARQASSSARQAPSSELRAPSPEPPPPASARQASPASPEPGRLLVRSTPSGAGVTINGVTRGVTPLALRDLTFGEHTIEVAYPGHDTRQQRITLTARRPSQSIDVLLQTSVSQAPRAESPGSSLSGSLQVASRPAGGQVFLDDNLVGTTPLLLPDVPTGSHRVRIELPGYQSFLTSVQIEPRARFRLAASLER